MFCIEQFLVKKCHGLSIVIHMCFKMPTSIAVPKKPRPACLNVPSHVPPSLTSDVLEWTALIMLWTAAQHYIYSHSQHTGPNPQKTLQHTSSTPPCCLLTTASSPPDLPKLDTNLNDNCASGSWLSDWNTFGRKKGVTSPLMSMCVKLWVPWCHHREP